MRTVATVTVLVLLQRPPLLQNRPTDLIKQTFEAKVLRVIDGDTVDVVRRHTDRNVRIRIEGIDAPETGEAFADEARTFARSLMFDRIVTVTGIDVDRYGRLVARVRVAEGDVGALLVAGGMACYYLQYSADHNLAAAEQRAKANRKGFWKPGSVQPRCVWSQPWVTSERGIGSSFTANVESGLYHTASCRNANCKNCTRRFATMTAAEQAGFRPARDCIKR
jgi:micrococcal nuclease